MSTEFRWTKETQGHLHSSFFIGYAISGIPSGLFSDQNGAKWILFVSFFAMGFFITMTPLCCAIQDVSILVINRIFMGIAEGVQGPAILSMVNEWFPTNERSTALGSIHSGMFSGSIVAFIIVPLLIMAFGWSWIYYIFGGLIFTWCMFWSMSVTSFASEHPLLSKEELMLIQSGGGGGSSQINESSSRRSIEMFQSLLKDKAVLAIAGASFCHDWAYYAAISWLPTYFVEAHGMTPQLAAFYSALPFLSQLCISLIAGRAGDILTTGDDTTSTSKEKVLSVRRWFSITGFIGASIFYLLSQLTNNTIQSVLFLCLAFSFDGLHVSGYLINPCEITPKHVGAVTGISNAFGCLAGFFANVVVGLLSHAASTNEGGKESFYGSEGGQMKNINIFTSSFIVLSLFQIFGAVIYGMYSEVTPREGIRNI